jgi:hypothetical protein
MSDQRGLTDNELAILLALAAPIAHDHRPGFVEAVVLELRAHGGELGAGPPSIASAGSCNDDFESAGARRTDRRPENGRSDPEMVVFTQQSLEIDVSLQRHRRGLPERGHNLRHLRGGQRGYFMHWQKGLAYTITPKSGPMRRMETLLDANRAFVQDLPRALFKKPYWLRVGKLLVLAAETGRPADIRKATESLLEVIDRHGWMERKYPHARRARPTLIDEMGRGSEQEAHWRLAG